MKTGNGSAWPIRSAPMHEYAHILPISPLFFYYFYLLPSLVSIIHLYFIYT